MSFPKVPQPITHSPLLPRPQLRSLHPFHPYPILPLSPHPPFSPLRHVLDRRELIELTNDSGAGDGRVSEGLVPRFDGEDFDRS